MIHFKDYIKYLNENELSSEELILLYILHFGKSKDIFEISKQYVDSNKSKIDYLGLIKSLENRSFLINFNTGSQISLTKISVVDWVADKYFVSQDLAFDEVFALYPKLVLYKDTPYATFTTVEESSKLYFNRIHNGIKSLHERFVKVTKDYLQKGNFIDFAPMKFAKWLDSYESIASEYDKRNSITNFYDKLNR